MRAAIDDGIAKQDEHTLTVVVIAYLVVNAIGWLCQLALIRGLAAWARASSSACAATCSTT